MKLSPKLRDGVFVFCTEKYPSDLIKDSAVAVFTEEEGTTLILQKGVADQFQLDYNYEAAWITLELETKLQDVGITALFSAALANAGISVNVMAGFYHDHLFVPKSRCEEAMQVLKSL